MLHLVHPALVHFSVAFLVVGGCVEAWGILARADGPTRFGERLLLIGMVSLLPTLFSGYVAANTVALDAVQQRLLDAHERNAWFVLGACLGLVFWRSWHRGELPPRQRPLYAVGLLLTVALVLWSALLGGEMVYLHGVGVR